MESQESGSGMPDSHETETQVQDAAAAATPAEGVQQAGHAPPAAPSQGFLDRFSRGAIAAGAAVLGIAVGAGGMAVAGDHDRDGWRHHGPGFGMRDGGRGWDDGGQGGPGMRRGPDGPGMSGGNGYGQAPPAQQGGSAGR